MPGWKNSKAISISVCSGIYLLSSFGLQAQGIDGGVVAAPGLEAGSVWAEGESSIFLPISPRVHSTTRGTIYVPPDRVGPTLEHTLDSNNWPHKAINDDLLFNFDRNANAESPGHDVDALLEKWMFAGNKYITEIVRDLNLPADVLELDGSNLKLRSPLYTDGLTPGFLEDLSAWANSFADLRNDERYSGQQAWEDPDHPGRIRPEVLESLINILPYMMPAGPDGSSPVFPQAPVGSDGSSPVFPIGPDGTPSVVPVALKSDKDPSVGGSGGGVVYLRNPDTLDWDGGMEGDKSCFLPPTVRPEELGAKVNGVRLTTVLVGATTKVFLENADGSFRVAKPERCSAGAGSRSNLHCTGLAEMDGMHVWTAAHCVMNFYTGMLEEDQLNLAVGQTTPCRPEARFRAASLLGLSREDFVVEPNYVGKCEYVERVARDIVRIKMQQPLFLIPSDNKFSSDWRFPMHAEIDELVQSGRRVYGTGFMQTPRLRDQMGGRVMPMKDCAATLAKILDPNIVNVSNELALEIAKLVGDAVIFSGFVCTSMDTMNGGSGGPVFAVTDDGKSLVLIGFVSAAVWTDANAECDPTPLEDKCGVTPIPGLNLFALLPETFTTPD